MLERGFKSWGENTALQIRKELKLHSSAPLLPDSLATYLDVQVWTPRDVKGLSSEALRTLLGTERNNWSAITVSTNGLDAVIHNPNHSLGRRASNIMHELAHLVIGHTPATVFVSPDGALALRSFDRKQEDEANWLSGCLLLPRPALLRIAQSGVDLEAACQEYGVSNELLTSRMNMTGVTAQVRRRLGRS